MFNGELSSWWTRIAIGLLTKLSLREDMSRLLEDVRAYRRRASLATLSDLRRRFDSLVNRVLTLVHEDDRDLALEVAAIREDLWLTLAEGRGSL